MPNALALPLDVAPIATALDRDLGAAADYAREARSEPTRRAHARDVASFTAYCDARGVASMPASLQTIAANASSMAQGGRAVAGITRALAALSVAHKIAGHPSPTAHDMLRETLKGIRRDLGVAQAKKSPIVVTDLRRIVEPLGDDLAAVRDRALLLLGFTCALRRSEIAALDAEDVAIVAAGAEVTIRHSKTDQEGRGAVLVVRLGSTLSTCPVRALLAWRTLAAIESGPLFVAVTRDGRIVSARLSGEAVASIVQRRAAAAGIEDDIAGHSLRAGFATSAADAGCDMLSWMRQMRHRSMAIASGDARRHDAWKNNAAAKLGL